MDYDFLEVTKVKHDRATGRLEVETHGETHVVEGVKRLYLKSVPFIDQDGTVFLNKGRVSLNGDEAAAGD